ncbi:MAG: hypothetical protein P8X82_05420 [Gemmatimonadales bacterium]|jgi:hypothetical protein
MNKIYSIIAVGAMALMIAVPARGQETGDVAGKWETTRETPRGTMTSTFTFQVEGNKLTGSIGSQMGDVEISEGTVEGNKISFKMVMSRGDRTFEMSYSGTVEGDTITGTMETPRGEVPWTAKRIND